MAKEIEFRYLVDALCWEPQGEKQHIVQGYLFNAPTATMRVRICNDQAYLTLKGPKKNAVCDEFEYEIPLQDAQEMLEKFTPGNHIEKTRYSIMFEGFKWEVDVYGGENQGLILAEVESPTGQRPLHLPPWVDKEITDLPQYHNNNLAQYPFSQWNHDIFVP